MNYRKGHRKPGVRIKLSRLKRNCPDQLAPFEGLWGYSRELEYYEGTIFRFPLRPVTVHSRLKESNTPLDYHAAQRYMEEFLGEARISLLFLRHVRSIDFRLFEDIYPRWSVISPSGQLNDDFSNWTVCTVTKGDGSDVGASIEDRWWTAIQDTIEFPTELLKRHKRSMKDVECGIAALVSSKAASKDAKVSAPPKARIFSVLPLPLTWDLPVHVHATFITFGDRNSIMIESSAREDGADWNRWLLTSAISSLYLPFLEDLARKIRKDVFNFWPKQVPPKGSLSELVYTSFWEQLLSSSCRLFPLARQLDMGKRKPPKLLEVKVATFDFLPSATSAALRDILESRIPTLVRVPPAIARKLKSLQPTVISVTPSLLRKIFQSEAAAEHLAKTESRFEVLEILLQAIMPNCNTDFEELNGCRVLPLADGRSGMLSIQDPFKPTVTYYIASKREVEVFDFASELLTPEDQGKDFKVAILNHQKKFNIKRLDLSDIGTLLGKKDFQANTPALEFDAWLRQFWMYWHEREINIKESVETTFMSATGVHDYPILEATCDGVKTYLRPSDLGNFPSVVEPADEQHKKMCDKIPGLYRLNIESMPVYLKEAEASLKSASSFYRFIKSLSVLAVKQAGGLESYIRQIFGEVELEVCCHIAFIRGHGNTDIDLN
jgi:sacsin